MQHALLLFLIALSYALFAGSPRWTLLPLLAVAAAAALVAPRRTFTFPRETRALDLALVALTVGVAVQLLPLPSAVVDWLSPHAAELRHALVFRGGPPPSWVPLSIDPSATADALATVTLGVLAFWVARGMFSFGASTRHFCRMLALLGAIAALSAVAVRAAMPGTVFGVSTPTARSANPFGAFVNRNHFAGWLLLLAGPVWGYLIAHLRIHPAYRGRFLVGLKQFLSSGALILVLGALVVVGVMFLTLSRSAAAGLAAAALVGWRVGRHRLRIERSNLPGMLALAGVGLLSIVLFVDISGWSTRLEESFETSGDRNRLTIWRESLPAVRDFWLTGTGSGTFGDAMVTYQRTRVWIGSMSRWAHFNNAHSHYIQVAAEGGALLLLPVLVALWSLVAAGRAAIEHDRGEMQWARIGAAGALVGIAIQSIWETSLVLPANAVLCGSIAGLLLYRRVHHGTAGAAAPDHQSSLAS